MRRSRGVTLIELVLAMLIVGIVVAGIVYFTYPLQQSVELTGRAELTDLADNALQRVGREVRLALPNSVRYPAGCGTACIEFIPVRTAGRYRAEPSGGGCDATTDTTGSDELAFDVADDCFKSIGRLADAGTITNADFLVLNNTGLAGQDAYAGSNRVQVGSAAEQAAARERITYSTFTFQRALHESPGRRFFIVSTPVAFVCEAGTLKRYSGYAFGASYTTGTAADIAANVSGCTFTYSPSVSPQLGLLTLQLALSKALSSAKTETVTLYQAIHVNNVP